MTTPLPNWVIDLVNAVATYEDEHADDHFCLADVLQNVPADVRRQAAAIREYAAQEGRTTRPADDTEPKPPRVQTHIDQRQPEPVIRHIPVIAEPWMRY